MTNKVDQTSITRLGYLNVISFQLALNRARGNITDQVARYKRFKLDSSSCKQ